MKIRQTKTSFTAGEVEPAAGQRVDLFAYENGARRLVNVCILPLGGLVRRPGLRYLASLPGKARLLAFEFNTEQTYLIALVHQAFRVYIGGDRRATVTAPWTEAQLAQLNWTQSADTLLVVHPDIEPQRITRSSHSEWTIGPWDYVDTAAGRIQQPQHKFAPDISTLQASATTGTGVTLTARVKKGGAALGLFSEANVGQQWLVGGKAVNITSIVSASSAKATVVETLGGTGETVDFSEPAWSAIRGWPVSVTFHQSRLVVGGSRSAPHFVWLSKTADLFNFFEGTGLDDEAIATPILSDRVDAVRAVFSGRHLQVMTSGGEYMVKGEPLTPTSIELARQTRLGSPVDRTVPPVSVDGGTVFVPRLGSGLFEFLYDDVEQAYRSGDLAMVAGHMLRDPVAMVYDQPRRWLHLVNADGTAVTVTVYREQKVQGWSRHTTAGFFRSAAQVGEDTFFAVERNGAWSLETFDASVQTDAALTGTRATPTTTWTGASHLNGKQVRVVADGVDAGTATVAAGVFVLDREARTVEAGLAYAHEIEPLPIGIHELGEDAPGMRMRLVGATFHVLGVRSLTVDAGLGLAAVPLRQLGHGLLDAPLPPFTGAKTVRGLGWSAERKPLWRIEDDTPLPFTLLAVESEVAVNP